MAIRIHTAITHGELDNTERGRIRGRLWLLGREEPVLLDLDGDAWRDVAGTRLSFVNPAAVAQPELTRLTSHQNGAAGDITASRKVKVFTVSEEEWKAAYREDRIADMPTEWRNSLYLEWFTVEQGRCVVESADFEITISEHVWEMDEDEEGAQKLANMHAMRDFLASIIQRPSEEDEPGEEDLTEAAWENRLKATDRLNEAGMEAYEKYSEDNAADEKTAFVMGWDNVLGGMADAQESAAASADSDQEWNETADELDESERWKAGAKEEAVPDEPHALKAASFDFVTQVMREIGRTQLRESPAHDQPADRLMFNLLQVSTKLGAALHSRRELEEPSQRSFVLAIAQRCLSWVNEALSDLEILIADPSYATDHPQFEIWKTGAIRLREGIVHLRQELAEE